MIVLFGCMMMLSYVMTSFVFYGWCTCGFCFGVVEIENIGNLYFCNIVVFFMFLLVINFVYLSCVNCKNLISSSTFFYGSTFFMIMYLFGLVCLNVLYFGDFIFVGLFVVIFGCCGMN